MRHGLGFHNRHSAGGFQPISLFTGGVQGAWYDPSDFGASGTDGVGTLFQDAAGTTPVTAVEQPVGLMLDKSKGLVLGSELITPAANRDFSSDTGYWSKNTGVTITGGQCVYTSVASQLGLNKLGFATAGTYYEVTFTIASITSGALRVYLGGNRGATVTFAGTYTQRIMAGSVDTFIYFEAFGTTTLTLDDVSVKEIAGNHAYQSINTSRPTLRARYNLLERTEALDNAYYSVTGTASRTTVDGFTTITEDTLNSTHYIFRSSVTTAPLGTQITVSVSLKAGTRRYVYVGWDNGSVGNGVIVDTQTWAFTLLNSISASVTNVGGGEYRVSFVGSLASGTTAVNFVVYGSSTYPTPTVTYLGNGSTIIVGKTDLRVTNIGSAIPAYQRVNAATDYTTAGFPPYLFFDGTDDSMLTNSVDFTGTDKMLVVAGVTKQSDANAGLLVELSATYATNNGTFAIFHPDVSNTSAFVGKGTTDAYYSPTPQSAPASSVLSMSLNIAGTTKATAVIPRINGVVSQTGGVGTTLGTGNFGNYPLYIGRRNNATFPFNGNIYSLVIAGAAYSAGQISSTESWVAAKTPLGTI